MSTKKENWYASELPTADTLTSKLLGYIIKCMEQRMREILKYKYNLTVNTESFIRWLNTRGNVHKKISRMLYDDILKNKIEDNVEKFFKINYPKVLLHPEIAYREPVIFDINIEEVEKARNIANENTEKLAVDDSFTEEDIINISTIASKDNDGVLLEDELIAMSIILSSDSSFFDLDEYCRKNNHMIEVLVETINEKLYDHFGDSVIELNDNDVKIYSDYYDEVKSLVRREA